MNKNLKCINCGKDYSPNKGRIIDGSIASDVFFEHFKFEYVCSYHCYVNLAFLKPNNKKKEQKDGKQ